MSDFHDLRAMEHPQGSKKPPSVRRTRSMDRFQNPKKDPETQDNQWSSLPSTSSFRNNGVHSSEIPAVSAEAQSSMITVLSAEETREFRFRKRSVPQESRKDKAQKQGWLNRFMNFILRTGPEEPKEKANKKAKGKEGHSQSTETPEVPAQQSLKKKAQDKKTSRKKHSHKKHTAEETKEAQDQEAETKEASLSQTNLGPALKGREDADLHHSLLVKSGDAGVLEAVPQVMGHQPEKEPRKLDKSVVVQEIVKHFEELSDLREKENGAGDSGPAGMIFQGTLTTDRGGLCPSEFCPGAGSSEQKNLPQLSEDAIIKMIVDYVRNAGDTIEEPEVKLPVKKRKTSLRRTFPSRKYSTEETKKTGAAGAASLESRPSKRSNYLTTCVRGHQASVSSISDLEVPEIQGTLTTDGRELHPSELCSGAGSPDHEKNLPLEKPEEAVIQDIVKLLIEIGDNYEKQAPVCKHEPVLQNSAPVTKKKTSEKKTTTRKKSFSTKKQGAEETKRTGSASLESKQHRRPTYLPLCVGGHRASVSSASVCEDAEEDGENSQTDFLEDAKGTIWRTLLSTSPCPPTEDERELQKQPPVPDGKSQEREQVSLVMNQTIQRLHELFQEVREELREQVRQHPSRKRYFREILDSHHERLMAILNSQKTVSGRVSGKPGQFLNLPDNFAGNNSHNVISLMDFAGQYGRRHSCSQFSYKEDQQNTSLDIQSPD